MIRAVDQLGSNVIGDSPKSSTWEVVKKKERGNFLKIKLLRWKVGPFYMIWNFQKIAPFFFFFLYQEDPYHYFSVRNHPCIYQIIFNLFGAHYILHDRITHRTLTSLQEFIHCCRTDWSCVENSQLDHSWWMLYD